MAYSKLPLNEATHVNIAPSSKVLKPAPKKASKCRFCGILMSFLAALLLIAISAIVIEIAVSYIASQKSSLSGAHQAPSDALNPPDLDEDFTCAVEYGEREACLLEEPGLPPFSEDECLGAGCCWGPGSPESPVPGCFVPVLDDGSDYSDGEKDGEDSSPKSFVLYLKELWSDFVSSDKKVQEKIDENVESYMQIDSVAAAGTRETETAVEAELPSPGEEEIVVVEGTEEVVETDDHKEAEIVVEESETVHVAADGVEIHVSEMILSLDVEE